MNHMRFPSPVELARVAVVTSVLVAFLCSGLLVSVSPVRAESFSATMNCPNNVSYSFTNDTKTSNQYYITVTDSKGNGLGSTAYSEFLRPGETLPKDSHTTLSLDLVRVPAPGDLTATLWRVTRDGDITEVSSITLTNCWPPSISTPSSGTTTTDAVGTPITSRIQFACTNTGIDLNLTDEQGLALLPHVTFDNQALLEAGADGIYRSVGNYGVLSVAGSQGWDSMYYYAAWNGGIYDATGQHDFSLTFQCK